MSLATKWHFTTVPKLRMRQSAGPKEARGVGIGARAHSPFAGFPRAVEPHRVGNEDCPRPLERAFYLFPSTLFTQLACDRTRAATRCSPVTYRPIGRPSLPGQTRSAYLPRCEAEWRSIGRRRRRCNPAKGSSSRDASFLRPAREFQGEKAHERPVRDSFGQSQKAASGPSRPCSRWIGAAVCVSGPGNAAEEASPGPWAPPHGRPRQICSSIRRARSSGGIAPFLS
jgi:hypothetical protein